MARAALRLNTIMAEFRPFSSSSASTAKAAAPAEPPVLFSKVGKCGIITLNRPKALNALNLQMVRDLTAKYKEWFSSDVQVLVMKGAGGKAFCAGGDIVAVRTLGVVEKQPSQIASNFFAEEYCLNYLIATSSIPQVSILNGITMGGGVGLSVHGKYRVATENTVFAMPETAIGLFPDVGGTHFLPTLGPLGMYLALTGTRLKGADVFHAGVATHYVPAAKIEILEQQLQSVKAKDEVGAVLEKFGEKIKERPSFEPQLRAIKDCFGQQSLDEIKQALSRDGSEWAKKQLQIIESVSPYSLGVTFRALKESGDQGLDIKQVLEKEYTIVRHIMEDGEFFEGVRALLIDKDNKPKWNRESVAERVNRTFQPFSDFTFKLK